MNLLVEPQVGKVTEAKIKTGSNWEGRISNEKYKSLPFILNENLKQDKDDYEELEYSFDVVRNLNGSLAAVNVLPIRTPFHLEKTLQRYPEFRQFYTIKTKTTLETNLDKKVQQIITEFCLKNESFAEQKFEKFISYRNKSAEIRQTVENASEEDRQKASQTMEKIISLYSNSDQSRVYAHFDMDMFFAACEQLRNPDLSGELFGIASSSVLATSNYEARKYG